MFDNSDSSRPEQANPSSYEPSGALGSGSAQSAPGFGGSSQGASQGSSQGCSQGLGSSPSSASAPGFSSSKAPAAPASASAKPAFTPNGGTSARARVRAQGGAAHRSSASQPSRPRSGSVRHNQAGGSVQGHGQLAIGQLANQNMVNYPNIDNSHYFDNYHYLDTSLNNSASPQQGPQAQAGGRVHPQAGGQIGGEMGGQGGSRAQKGQEGRQGQKLPQGPQGTQFQPGAQPAQIDPQGRQNPQGAQNPQNQLGPQGQLGQQATQEASGLPAQPGADGQPKNGQLDIFSAAHGQLDNGQLDIGQVANFARSNPDEFQAAFALAARAAKNPAVARAKLICDSDLKKIDFLLSSNALPKQQAIALRQQVFRNARYVYDLAVRGAEAALFGEKPCPDRASDTAQGGPCSSDAVCEFEKQDPSFFSKSDARAALRSFLAKDCPGLAFDEISRIAGLVVALENGAVSNYKALSDHEKNLRSSNRSAIGRLATDSAREKQSTVASARVFTREQIGSMSLSEFKKNRAEIFAQYRKGLIR